MRTPLVGCLLILLLAAVWGVICWQTGMPAEAGNILGLIIGSAAILGLIAAGFFDRWGI